MVVNAIRLLWSVNGFGYNFLRYPQFLIFPAFSPFMFEGVKVNNGYTIKIWKLGTIANGFFIGVVPHMILIISDTLRGVTKWKFHDSNVEKLITQNSDATFKHPLANTIFAGCSSSLFLILMFIYFGNEKLFRHKGIYCRIFNILFCPCPGPCIDSSPNPQMRAMHEPSSDLTPNTHSKLTNSPTTPGIVNDSESNIQPSYPLTIEETAFLSSKATTSGNLIYIYKGRSTKKVLFDERKKPLEDECCSSLQVK